LNARRLIYHFLLVPVDPHQMTVTMNHIDLSFGKAVWTQPDDVKIMAPAAVAMTR